MSLAAPDTGKHPLRASLRAARSALDPADRRDQARAITGAVVEYATGVLTRPAPGSA